MKIAINNYPFTVYAETKTSSKSGKEYLSVALRFRTKDKDGQAKDTYFNLFDERDLLVISNLCNRAYSQIVDNKTMERFEKSDIGKDSKDGFGNQSMDNDIEDDIPF